MSNLQTIRLNLAIIILGLVVSGITAFPLQHEVHALRHLHPWLAQVDNALTQTGANFPFLAYGTDWLAFAHLVIAVAFLGPWQDPVRNKFIITWGLIACAGVFPLALIAGPLRGLPFAWTLIDCSFGLFGAIPLLIIRHHTQLLEHPTRTPANHKAFRILD